jgi:citrate lyase beta subunit
MTTAPILPRRSVLYMPGANERALEKAKTLPADALILDLEDAVAPDAKADARDRVCAAVRSGEYGHPRQRPRHAVARRRHRRGSGSGARRGGGAEGELG